MKERKYERQNENHERIRRGRGNKKAKGTLWGARDGQFQMARILIEKIWT